MKPAYSETLVVTSVMPQELQEPPKYKKMVGSRSSTCKRHLYQCFTALDSKCKTFFNCKNVALADQELHQFKDMGLGDVDFAHGTTQAIHNGVFLYSEGSASSNFTLFSFFEQQLLEQDD
eukprot:12761354-Ditylum_brightwellii.AAC.1